MKLSDVRRLAIRQQVRVRFRLNNGMECIVDEHGVSRVAALDGPPDFNLEDEFAVATSFELEPVRLVNGRLRIQELTRQELETLAAGAGPSGQNQDQED